MNSSNTKRNQGSKPQNKLKQIVTFLLTAATAGILIFLLYLEIILLSISKNASIPARVMISDILVGLTIYLKTSVDFAIFTGNLMSSYQGIKNRIAIETGTAFGNALGTMLILAVWYFLKDIKVLLAIMIFLAALVLLRLSEESLEHIDDEKNSKLKKLAKKLETVLSPINKFFDVLLRFIIPDFSIRSKTNLSFFGLFAMSFTIPFILGLDDFAGYVPLFNIVHVFGFAIGVVLGHMLLNIFLFLSPKTTIKVVKHPVISFLGAISFIGLALWGIFEVYKILFIR